MLNHWTTALLIDLAWIV